MASKSFPLFIVDAFTKKRFSGNGAAICTVNFDENISTDVMQKIAAEMNLSETAFVSPVSANDSFSDGSKYFLRWFSPTSEVPLCGHATLATASVLFNIYGNESDNLEFDTKSGILVASSSGEGRITIDLPSYYPNPVMSGEYSNLIRAVVGDLSVEEVLISPSRKLLIRLADSVTRKKLEGFKPSAPALLSAVPEGKVLGVIVTLRGRAEDDCTSEDGEQYDFLSRYFAPWLGILEDPVTGSAHSVLGPYWSKTLQKRNLFARQCSPRGGELRIEVNEQRTILSGDTVIVLRGELSL